MPEKFVVVINVSNKDLRIPELKQVLPGGLLEEKYVLPYDIAIKYKSYLHPVAIIDPDKQDEPIKEEKIKEEIPRKPRKPRKKKINKRKSGDKPLKGVKLKNNKCEMKQKVTEIKRGYNKKYKESKEAKNAIQTIS